MIRVTALDVYTSLKVDPQSVAIAIGPADKSFLSSVIRPRLPAYYCGQPTTLFIADLNIDESERILNNCSGR